MSIEQHFKNLSTILKLQEENARLRSALLKVCDYAEEISCDNGATFRITEDARKLING